MGIERSGSWKAEGPRHWLTLAWQGALVRVLESMVGPETLAATRISAAPGDPAAWQRWVSPLWCRMPLDLIPGAAVWAGCSEPAMQALGRLAAGGVAMSEAECRETVLEIFSQAASVAADAISHRAGKRASFGAAEPSAVPGPADCPVHIELTIEGSTHVFGFAADAAIVDALDREADAHTAPAASPSSRAAGPAASKPRNLELLMEVELPVCVTFGRTQLPLKDVLKLSSGSIIELNRLANEPVDILINNSVIARGEVVVVDGNYGIRVTEIVSRKERIRSFG
jgi:flagellar motor switch protein FliN/FliY